MITAREHGVLDRIDPQRCRPAAPSGARAGAEAKTECNAENTDSQCRILQSHTVLCRIQLSLKVRRQ